MYNGNVGGVSGGNNNIQWSRQLADKLDEADGKKDGKINASVWNGYLSSMGSRGNRIKNYITVDNASRSFNYYDTQKDAGKVEWDNWETKFNEYTNKSGENSDSSNPVKNHPADNDAGTVKSGRLSGLEGKEVHTFKPVRNADGTFEFKEIRATVTSDDNKSSVSGGGTESSEVSRGTVVTNGKETEVRAYAPVVKSDGTAETDNNFPQALTNAKDIPAQYAKKDGFYSRFVNDGEVFNDGALSLRFTMKKDADGTVTYSGKDIQGTPVTVKVTHNSDGTTRLDITEFGNSKKTQIVDTETGTLLYGQGNDGEQTFFNADGSETVYDKANKLLRTIPAFEGFPAQT